MNLTHHFLIAMPGMEDASFARSVVYLCEHSERGALGLIINKPTDILSFPLSDNFGEMYINIEMTKLEAKKFERTYENFLGFLFIHGLVHLKGLDHGSTMESIEARFRKKFGI